MSTSKTVATLGILSALTLCSACIVDTEESEEGAHVSTVESPLGVGADVDDGAVDADGDQDEAEGADPILDADPRDIASPLIRNTVDDLGYQDEPDPVPWTPGKTGQDGSSSNNDS